MSKTLQLKRGELADLPLLAEAEPVWVTDDEQLYVGGASGNQPVCMDRLPADVSALLGGAGSPSEGLAAIPRVVVNPGWQVLQEYKVAGSYTWTAPDLFGGKSYKVGVAIIGGGGSGGVGVYRSEGDSAAAAAASGGASGLAQYRTFTVIPGNTYTLVVGAGGAAVTITGRNTQADGNAGGTSSFNGVTALGGGAGAGSANSLGYGSVVADGATGGQGSDIGSPQGAYWFSQVPYGGKTPPVLLCGGTLRISVSTTYAAMSINPFTGELCLIAGGAAGSYNGSPYLQPTVTLSAGRGSSGGNSSAAKGTAPGCGGGGAVNSSNTSNIAVTVTSAAGCDGMVTIYAQGVTE